MVDIGKWIFGILGCVMLSPLIVFVISVFVFILTGNWLLINVSDLQYAAGFFWCLFSAGVIFGLT